MEMTIPIQFQSVSEKAMIHITRNYDDDQYNRTSNDVMTTIAHKLRYRTITDDMLNS